MGEGNVNIAIEAGADAEVTPYSMHVGTSFSDTLKLPLFHGIGKCKLCGSRLLRNVRCAETVL